MKIEKIDLDKKFDIIYIDPPWAYDEVNHGGKKPLRSSKAVSPTQLTGSADEHYNTVHINDLKEWDFSHICNDNCLMFMWAVSPNLDQAIDLGVTWGFEYITVGFVWDKMKAIPGNYTISQVELCLLFKKGKIPDTKYGFDPQQKTSNRAGIRNTLQYYAQRSKRHSSKPHEFRRRIYEMFPLNSKIEIFARQKYPDWDAWGNDIKLKEEIQEYDVSKIFNSYDGHKRKENK